MDGSDFGHELNKPGWIYHGNVWKWFANDAADGAAYAIYFVDDDDDGGFVAMYRGEDYLNWFAEPDLPRGLTLEQKKAWLVAYWSTAQ